MELLLEFSERENGEKALQDREKKTFLYIDFLGGGKGLWKNDNCMK